MAAAPLPRVATSALSSILALTALPSPAQAAAAAAPCSADYAPCLDSQCCASSGYGCFRRPDKDFAQCRPMKLDAPCDDTEQWLCPGWEQGAADYENCFSLESGRKCQSPDFGCYKRRGVEFAQCRPLPRDANKVLSACYDTDRWRCPGWQQCSASRAECTTSRCCEDPNDGCYKRPYAHYAECRPKVAECIDTREWLCPGSEGRSIGMGSWENCAQPWQKCLESGCCAAHNFGCFKKRDIDYAQCRPLYKTAGDTAGSPAGSTPVGLGEGADDAASAVPCQDDDGGEWRCPGWQRCSRKFENCMSSRCCADSGFRCFKRPMLHYAQCRPLAEGSEGGEGRGEGGETREPGTCTSDGDDDWLCPGTWEQCSGANDDCTSTLCCSNTGFTCYDVSPAEQLSGGQGRCLRNGECQAAWGATGATCAVLTPEGKGPQKSGDVEALKQHVEQVAIAIVVGVLGGLCVLSTCIVLLVRHYCKAELQELMAQRTLRKQAHRQRLAKTDDHLGVANVGVAEEADVEEEAAADPVTASKASAKPDGASPDAARGAAEQVGKKQAEVELQQDMSI